MKNRPYFASITKRKWDDACLARIADRSKEACANFAKISHAHFYRHLKHIRLQFELWEKGEVGHNVWCRRHEQWIDAEQKLESAWVAQIKRTSSGAQWLLQKNFDHYKDEGYKAIDYLRLGIYLGRGLVTEEEIREELGERVLDQLLRGATAVLLESPPAEQEDSPADRRGGSAEIIEVS